MFKLKSYIKKLFLVINSKVYKSIEKKFYHHKRHHQTSKDTKLFKKAKKFYLKKGSTLEPKNKKHQNSNTKEPTSKRL